MENAHICQTIILTWGESAFLLAFFYGHGAKEMALFAQQTLFSIYNSQSFNHSNYEDALTDTFINLD